ncbi:MAG: GTPase [Actinomycetota bacterium]|jgi:GTP-binding protein Era|nr:GTPase [Actinomycetota bacterium]
MRSGFATLIGRPNVGKSTLLNTILGTKVSIVSNKPQTTRSQVRGVLTRPDAQIVFVDTPGIHKPRGPLSSRLNDTARSAAGDVDVVLFVLDATQPFGRGDRFVAAPLPKDALVVVNKGDIASRKEVIEMLTTSAELDFAAYFPVSAVTGDGVPALVDAIVERLPEGPKYYPDDEVTDVPEAFWVAELVREQLFRLLREELPHSVATRVTEWEWPRVRVEILVERDSQKGIVIGRGGLVLKEVGTLVREQLPEGAFVELFVRVTKDWQRRGDLLDRLGY